MTIYIDKSGNEIFVHDGISNERSWATYRRNPRTGGLHRVKSPDMPPVESKDLAQENLDRYARKHKLKVKQQLKDGDLVDYHSIIDGPVTISGVRLRGDPFMAYSGTEVAFIEGMAGYVAGAALTLHKE
jgi:hypothetical protein